MKTDDKEKKDEVNKKNEKSLGQQTKARTMHHSIGKRGIFLQELYDAIRKLRVEKRKRFRLV